MELAPPKYVVQADYISDPSYFRIVAVLDIMEDCIKQLNTINRVEKRIPLGLKGSIRNLESQTRNVKIQFKSYPRPRAKYSEV